MTAVLEVARAIPDGRAEIADLAPELGIDDLQLGVFHRYFGLKRVCVAQENSYVDMLTQAGDALELLRGNKHRVRYVIGARTLATVAHPDENPLHEVAERLGLGHALVFTLTQHACASALLAVDLAGRLLAADASPDALALVLTGEKAVSPESRTIAGITVMGEATAACLVAADLRDEPRSADRVLSYATRTLGEFHQLPLPHELAAGYGNQYVPVLVEVIREALDSAGLEVLDLARILPHNVNRISWKRACRMLGYPLTQVHLENVPELGHCFGADTFINYVDVHRDGLLRPGDHYLMASVGLGSTFSAMVFEYGGVPA
ncbi:3-oxoacyl-ACP synthase [Pseudoclavibacter sp. AY1F1]|uniref:3-oxoacyl-[acyl-carrier-protein] synthase III C-terminal domain-containing protein n=1 Tax=Pseudoclavibacter sp. AY1F1 TaxID=2080583 RepID=UPI000CE83430|nr:3-oxoacyl-[acyl-carrier-protein] synthase III C-terminal domain-containing protein [Pseudoclavibacter sp. AY1F1]PPF42353.1 3-oxoacyl-ACP synthase [Pseudoclavibacter sp. AY1F1]